MNNDKKTNPIDKDTITETPGTLAYPHHRGSLAVKPTQEGKLRSNALSAMEQQTGLQMQQIQEQIELLARQAQDLKNRQDLSLKIYDAKMTFKPLISHAYYLYQKEDSSYILAMVAPNEWGRKTPWSEFVAKVQLLADHTWMMVD